MQAAAESVRELEVGEDEEALPSCHLVMFVAMRVCGSCLNPSHPSLRCLIVLEMSDPESNSDSTGVGALGCLCASASLLIISSSRCSLSTSSVLSGGKRWRSSSKTLVVHNWPSHKSSVCALTPSNTS
jgi:hypothetical protein